MTPEMLIDVSYAAPQAHGIINVAALHRGYSAGIVFIFSQGRKYQLQRVLLGYTEVTLTGVHGLTH
jgi:hypothetical protein